MVEKVWKNLKMHHRVGGKQQNDAQEKKLWLQNLQILSSSTEIKIKNEKDDGIYYMEHKFVPVPPEGCRRIAFVASCHIGPGS